MGGGCGSEESNITPVRVCVQVQCGNTDYSGRVETTYYSEEIVLGMFFKCDGVRACCKGY